MKDSLEYNSTNVEYGYKFLNNTKDYRLQYINYLTNKMIFLLG